MPYGSESYLWLAEEKSRRNRERAAQLGNIVRGGVGAYQEEMERIRRRKAEEAERWFREQYLGIAQGQEARAKERETKLDEEREFGRLLEFAKAGVGLPEGTSPQLAEVSLFAQQERGRQEALRKLSVFQTGQEMERRRGEEAQLAETRPLELARLQQEVAEGRQTPEEQAERARLLAEAQTRGAEEGKRKGTPLLEWLMGLLPKVDPVWARQQASSKQAIQSLVAQGIPEGQARAMVLANYRPAEGQLTPEQKRIDALVSKALSGLKWLDVRPAFTETGELDAEGMSSLMAAIKMGQEARDALAREAGFESFDSMGTRGTPGQVPAPSPAAGQPPEDLEALARALRGLQGGAVGAEPPAVVAPPAAPGLPPAPVAPPARPPAADVGPILQKFRSLPPGQPAAGVISREEADALLQHAMSTNDIPLLRELQLRGVFY